MHLRSDEESIRNYKNSIADFGAAWLKPPGISKSLRQLREEEREMKDHQEALRREQLAQELAEAGSRIEMDSLLQGEEGMEELPDLDAEVPEADNSAFDSNEEGLDEEDTGSEYQTSGLPSLNDLSIPDDLIRRETLIHDRLLRDDDSSVIDEKDLTGMLLEEDLIPEHNDAEWINGTLRINQNIDLDDEIPDGEGYEHTDSEEEISSIEDGNESSTVGLN